MQETIPGAEPSAALRAFGPVGHLLFRASKVLAITGGLIFVAIVIMSIVSLTARLQASGVVAPSRYGRSGGAMARAPGDGVGGAGADVARLLIAGTGRFLHGHLALALEHDPD